MLAIFAELDEPYDADIFHLMERHTRGLLAVLPEDIVANNMKDICFIFKRD